MALAYLIPQPNVSNQGLTATLTICSGGTLRYSCLETTDQHGTLQLPASLTDSKRRYSRERNTSL